MFILHNVPLYANWERVVNINARITQRIVALAFLSVKRIIPGNWTDKCQIS